MTRGSKPGERRGGRRKGTPNKASAKREAEVAKGGKTPLQHLLDRMRNNKAPMAERIECAKAAAPYVHPRIVPTIAGGDEDPPITTITRVIISADERDDQR